MAWIFLKYHLHPVEVEGEGPYYWMAKANPETNPISELIFKNQSCHALDKVFELGCSNTNYLG